MAGIIHIANNNLRTGLFYIALGIVYLAGTRSFYKKSKEPAKVILPAEVKVTLDIELKSLILEGKDIVAIKRYRELTGQGLKEAKEYVDLLSEEI